MGLIQGKLHIKENAYSEANIHELLKYSISSSLWLL